MIGVGVLAANQSFSSSRPAAVVQYLFLVINVLNRAQNISLLTSLSFVRYHCFFMKGLIHLQHIPHNSCCAILQFAETLPCWMTLTPSKMMLDKLWRHETLTSSSLGRLSRVQKQTSIPFITSVVSYIKSVMLAYSLGHAATRDTNCGTLFVRSIYDVFREHAKTKDILSLMTRVWSERRVF